MPVKFSEDEVISSPTDKYRVVKVLSQGAFAHSAHALSQIHGDVFIKRYFSPTRSLPWYQSFIAHQEKLKSVIVKNNGLNQYCYQFIEFFEGTSGRSANTFHQTFQLIKNGKSLSDFLIDSNIESDVDWHRRVRFARIIMMAITALHAHKIVHTDLKPDNFFLLPNPFTPGDFHLKLIDLDWSIFSNKRAPWHGQPTHGQYVGTPMYFSPEHVRGDVPTEKSDVFTCGIILCELLSGKHPFQPVSDYNVAIQKADYQPINILRDIPKIDETKKVSDLIKAALDPNPLRRPDAEHLRDALLGRKPDFIPLNTSDETRIDRSISSDNSKVKDAKTDLEKPHSKSTLAPLIAHNGEKSEIGKKWTPLILELDGKVVARMNIGATIGRSYFKAVSDDAKYLSDQQFKLFRSSNGKWCISPVHPIQNATIVDGHALIGDTELTDGMRISVGNVAKGIEKLPLIVRLK